MGPRAGKAPQEDVLELTWNNDKCWTLSFPLECPDGQGGGVSCLGLNSGAQAVALIGD